MKYENIYTFLNEITPISEEAWQAFADLLVPAEFEKQAILVQLGDDSDRIHFILEGVARNYFTNEDGREFTKIFRGTGGLIGPYMENLAGIPTRYTIAAITELKTVHFSLEEFKLLMERDLVWQKVGRIFAEQNFLEKEEREYMLMHMNIEQKHNAFLEKFATIKEQIPQYQIASYLGVTPEALNRYLKKKN